MSLPLESLIITSLDVIVYLSSPFVSLIQIESLDVIVYLSFDLPHDSISVFIVFLRVYVLESDFLESSEISFV